jgi:hydroxypyruvate reductase
VAGVELAHKQAVTRALLRAGAPIEELNAVRKHLSRLKGGQLARLAAPARVVALVLSDVVGDDLATIGSGPTAPDPTSFADALAVLERRGVRAPRAVRRVLEQGALGERPETPKSGNPLFRRVSHHIIGGNRSSLLAAERELRRRGLRTLRLTSRLEGEAREVARALVAMLHECADSGVPARPPVCLLVGGETTVSVRGPGRGGRNQELAVACARPLARLPRHAVVASLASDGVDGNSDAAGGVVDDTSLARAAALGLEPPEDCLARSDSRAWLDGLGDLVVTGPTGTNVVDLMLLLCGARLLPRAPGRRDDV